MFQRQWIGVNVAGHYVSLRGPSHVEIRGRMPDLLYPIRWLYGWWLYLTGRV